ncbi:MAG: tetratricopeptide repeat protein [Deltaproteobacteria bacterium]|nr:tetratricopeptide repeat protein [Deltaproteobacteria bacterium]
MNIITKIEINKALMIRFILCLLSCVGALLVIWISTRSELFTLKHVFILSLCAIPLSIILVYAVERLGSGIGGILTGWTARGISPREQLSADLAKARYAKGSGHFEEALSIINQVLEKDPDFPDALYLKVHILWEGFNNSKDALKCLIRIMELVRDDEPIYNWASNYYHEVKKGHIVEN